MFLHRSTPPGRRWGAEFLGDHAAKLMFQGASDVLAGALVVLVDMPGLPCTVTAICGAMTFEGAIMGAAVCRCRRPGRHPRTGEFYLH